MEILIATISIIILLCCAQSLYWLIVRRKRNQTIRQCCHEWVYYNKRKLEDGSVTRQIRKCSKCGLMQVSYKGSNSPLNFDDVLIYAYTDEFEYIETYMDSRVVITVATRDYDPLFYE